MARRFQFRLKSLLLVMVFLGILCGVSKWSYDDYIARLPAQLPWKPYSRAEMSKLKSGSRPVLVFFAADWEIFSSYILRDPLGDHKVAAELKRQGFEFRLADWTYPNPEIEQALNDYQSNSIPLIVIHPAGRFDEPIILRDLVSKNQMLKAIEIATSPRQE